MIIQAMPYPNSTPDIIATIRGASVVTAESSDREWSLPVGSAVGDLAILFVGSFFLPDPNGMEVIEDGGVTGWTAMTIKVVLDSSLIAAGKLEVNHFTSSNWVMGGVVFVGNPSAGIRTFDAVYTTGDAVTVTTPDAAQEGDYAIYFGSGTQNADCTSSGGTELDEEHGTNRCAVIAGETLTTNGPVSSTFNYGAAGPTFQAIVVVGASNPPFFIEEPVITTDSGFYGVGDTFTVNFSHTGTSEDIEWLADGVAISGETGATYVGDSDELGAFGDRVKTSLRVGPGATPAFATHNRVAAGNARKADGNQRTVHVRTA